jgi:hypothetical protein
VDGLCVGYSGLPELKKHCSVALPPDLGDCGRGGRTMYRCYVPRVEGTWLPHVHKPCAHNAIAGLVQRTLGVTPPVTDLLPFRKAVREILTVVSGRVELPVLPHTHEQVAEAYRCGKLRTRYREAARSLSVEGLCTRRDARVSAFVKAEKLSGKLSKPRIIMGRDPRYNLELAAYLKPVEAALYTGLRGWGKCFTRTRLVAKGLDAGERAALIRRKLQARSDLVCFEIDGLAFEAHFSLPVLKEEHGAYYRLCPDPRLRELLSWQLSFTGRFRSGVRYRARGVRASGDYNTGSGNTLVMCALVVAAAEACGTRWDFLADGDNAVVFVRARDLDTWRRELPVTFLRAGFEVKIGEAVSAVEEVDFGRSRPVCVDGVWRMVRDPLRVLSGAFCGHSHYSEMRGGIRILRAVAYCEAVLGEGVPVLQEFAHAMLRKTRGVRWPRDPYLDNYEYQRVVDRHDGWSAAHRKPVSLSTRLSFAQAWGVSVEEQLRWERLFRVDQLPTGWDQTTFEECLSAVDPWERPFNWWEAGFLRRLVAP